MDSQGKLTVEGSSRKASSAKMNHYMQRMQGRGSQISRIQHDLSHCSLATERQPRAVAATVQVSFPRVEPIKSEIGVLPGLDCLCHSLKSFLF